MARYWQLPRASGLCYLSFYMRYGTFIAIPVFLSFSAPNHH
jgi:hypothetical protein